MQTQCKIPQFTPDAQSCVELAKAIVDRFLASRFDGGSSALKVDAITGFERSQAAAAGRGQGA